MVQVTQNFRHLQLDKVNEYFNGDICHRVVYDFLDNVDHQAIFFKENKGVIAMSPVFQLLFPISKFCIFLLQALLKSVMSPKRQQRAHFSILLNCINVG